VGRFCLLCNGRLLTTLSVPFPLRLPEIFIAQDRNVGILGARVAWFELQSIHIGRGFLSAIVQELFAIVRAGFIHGFSAPDDIVHEVERQEIGLFIMAARRDFADRSFHDDTAIEASDIVKLVDRDAIIDERFDAVHVGRGKAMLVENP